MYELDDGVRQALDESQRLGHLGGRDIGDVVQHARGFVDALVDVTGVVADLGAGGGVPGLIIGHDRPDLKLVLIDRRSARTDFLDRVVRRLQWTDRVEVVAADVHDVARQRGPWCDAVVARGFGPPAMTLQAAAAVAVPGAVIVVSEPPQSLTGDRWDPQIVADLGLKRLEWADPRVVCFARTP